MTVGEKLVVGLNYAERFLAGACFVAVFPAGYIAIPAVWHVSTLLAAITGAALIGYALRAIRRCFDLNDDGSDDILDGSEVNAPRDARRTR